MGIFLNKKGQGIVELIVVIALASILIIALVALATRSNRSTSFSKTQDQAARLAQEGIELIKNIRAKNAVGAINHYCENAPGNSGIGEPTDPNSCIGTNVWIDGAIQTRSWSDLYTRNFPDDQAFKVDFVQDDPLFMNHPTNYGWQAHFHQKVAGPVTLILDPTYTAYANAHGTAGPQYTQAQVTSDGAGCATTVSWCIDLHHNPEGVTLNGRLFRRWVYIADTPPNLPAACTGEVCGKSRCNATSGADFGNDWKSVKQFSVLVTWDDQSGSHQQVSSVCLRKED
ncbi:MAG TPA: hypothetical protein VLE47_04625 [Candidatus Saccharimonadales bacterium]|nr:hypothetical protein [Candidatus Saccharimonadales bacterium]